MSSGATQRSENGNLRCQLLEMEYKDSVARIKLANDFDNEHKIRKYCSKFPRSPDPLLLALVIEDREVGRKAKRAVDYSRHQKRKCMVKRHLRGPRVDPVTGNSGIESEKSLMSSGHGPDPGTPKTHTEELGGVRRP